MSINQSNPIILVVDDSPDSLGMLNSALNQAGYTVLVALDGKQALDIIQQIEPKVILMDAQMPRMNGFECCLEVRKILPLIPIIFMTGLTESEHIIKAFEHGGTDYITKPVNPAELLARISTHIASANLINDARTALDTAKQYVFSVDHNGETLWATPETNELFELNDINISDKNNDFSKNIKQWINNDDVKTDLLIKTDSKDIEIRYFKQISENEHLLRVLGQSLPIDALTLADKLPITKRESEVLMWVAQGKTNKEIGEALSLSPRTINKHLEQLYQKIHVDNRASATSIAIQALLGKI